MLENDFVKKATHRMFTTFQFNVVLSLYTKKFPSKKRIGIQSHVYSGVAIPVELMVISTPGGGRVENRLLIEIAHRATPVEE